MSAHTKKARIDGALRACATLRGDTIVAELGPGLFLAQNPSIPLPTVLRVADKHAARKECTVLRHLRGFDWPAAPRICGKWHHESLACLRMEFANGASLKHKFSGKKPDRVFDVKAVFDVARLLANQLRLLHHHNVLHLNIKPDTVLINDGSVKLIGWKHARLVDAAHPRTSRLSGSFCAPEALRGRINADAKLDVWSFGATMYFIATAGNVLPAAGFDQLSLPHMPMWFVYMINDACCPDPGSRLSMSALCTKYFSIKARPWPPSLVAHRDLATGENDSSHDATASDDEDSIEFEHSPVRTASPAAQAKPKTRASLSPALQISCEQRFRVTRMRANSCVSAPNVLDGPKLARCLRYPSLDAGLAGRLPE